MVTKASKVAAPAAATPAPAATPAAAPAAVVLYTTIGAKPYNPKANTKNGSGGCAGTWAAVQAHLQANGPSTFSALRAVALANGDPAFIGYCVAHGRLVPHKA